MEAIAPVKLRQRIKVFLNVLFSIQKIRSPYSVVRNPDQLRQYQKTLELGDVEYLTSSFWSHLFFLQQSPKKSRTQSGRTNTKFKMTEFLLASDVLPQSSLDSWAAHLFEEESLESLVCRAAAARQNELVLTAEQGGDTGQSFPPLGSCLLCSKCFSLARSALPLNRRQELGEARKIV